MMKTFGDIYLGILERGCHEQLGPPGKGWKIEQNPIELATFLADVQPVFSVLEIGTGHRAGLARFMATVMEARVVTVDIVDYGHALEEGIRLVVLEEGRKAEFDETFDLVFLDGDKTYEGMKEAYQTYLPYASKIIALHDIAGLRGCEGVARFWNEISKTRTGRMRTMFHQMVADEDTKAGIGWQRIWKKR